MILVAKEAPMTPLRRVWIRVVLAFAIGVGIVVLEVAAYASYERNQSLIGVNIVWLEMLLAFVGAFALAFKWRPLRGGSPAPGAWLADIDSSGLLIPLVMVAGVTVAETIGLIRHVMIDPSTLPISYVHLAFQFIQKWLELGLAALAGSMLARAMSWAASWALNRVRVG
jgi:hypothetical protein